MQLFSKLAALIACIFLAACGGSQNFTASGDSFYNQNQQTISFISENERTLPPFGYVDFCMRVPAECPEWRRSKQYMSDFSPTAATQKPTYGASIAAQTQKRKSAKVTQPKQPKISRAQILKQLQKVNHMVNVAVRPVSDAEGFGVTENWRIPDISGFYGDIGDCEDYALLKRKILSQNGYNYNDLSMAVVKQSNGNIHAVLVVRTDFGDYVLDNLQRNVKPWDRSGYVWMKKQSISNPAIWVSVSA